MLKNNPNGSPSLTLLMPRSALWRIIPVHNSVGVILVAVFYNSLLLKIRAEIWKHSYNRPWYKLPVWTHQMVPGLHASDWSHLKSGRDFEKKQKTTPTLWSVHTAGSPVAPSRTFQRPCPLYKPDYRAARATVSKGSRPKQPSASRAVGRRIHS